MAQYRFVLYIYKIAKFFKCVNPDSINVKNIKIFFVKSLGYLMAKITPVVWIKLFKIWFSQLIQIQFILSNSFNLK